MSQNRDGSLYGEDDYDSDGSPGGNNQQEAYVPQEVPRT